MRLNSDRPTIFLDFDGVLHPTDYLRFESVNGELVLSGDSRFCWAEDLSNLLHGFECDLIVHSSWRNSYSVEQLREFLPLALAKRVVAVTEGESRYASILGYVSSHSIESYVILDDAADEFPSGCNQLILCTDGKGIRGQKAQRALSEFLSKANFPKSLG